MRVAVPGGGLWVEVGEVVWPWNVCLQGVTPWNTVSLS